MSSPVTRGKAGFLAILLALVGLVAAPAAAHAADPLATEATLSNVKFVETTVTDGKDTQLTGEWKLPDRPTAPAGFTLELPAELQGKPDKFPLLTPDTQERMGSCVVDETSLSCTVDPAYLQENPLQLQGSFTFWAKTRLNNTQVVEKEFTFKDVEGSATVEVQPGGQCTTNCDFAGLPGAKYGYYQNDADTMTWVIEVPAPSQGLNAGDEVKITDTLGSLQELWADGAVSVQEATTLDKDDAGRMNPVWKEFPADRYTVTKDPLTISWTASQGSYYRAFVRVNVTDGGVQGTYKNAATIQVGRDVVKDIEGTITRYGGSGTGLGTNEGRFTVTKALEGTAQVPETRAFTLNFTVKSAAGDTIDEGTAPVSAAQPFISKNYPRGSVVHLSEEAPAAGGAVAWETPVFSINDFALAGGTQVNVTLTNTATLLTGTFQAKKVLEGDAADLVPAGDVFELAYSYPAGEGFEKGAGVLRLRADGEAVTSPRLPVGAVVSLKENAPADVAGAVWGEAKLSSEQIVISADPSAVGVVTLTNTAELPPTTPPTSEPPASTPPTTPEPTPPTTSTPPTTPGTTPPGSVPPATTPPGGGEPPLAATGAAIVPLTIGAASALLLGAGLVLGLRRRATH